jgi:hypothetical protein
VGENPQSLNSSQSYNMAETTLNGELIPAPETTTATTEATEIEYTLETLPDLLPQQRLMLDNILNGDNFTEAYRKAGYTSQYAKQAAFVLISRNPLKAHLDYFFGQLSKYVSKDYIICKLAMMTDRALDSNNDISEYGDIAIKAIQELNKIKGNYAATNVNVNSTQQSINDIRNVSLEYKKEC